MKFNLKKYNTSAISYKEGGQIPKGKLKDGSIVNTNSIVFEKPYKLQMGAKEKTEIRESLLEYCKLDTLAMVKVLKRLKEAT